MLNNGLTGSRLTRAMLARGDQQVWCAVADYSDEEAMQDLVNNDFTAFIVSSKENSFFCTGGMEWKFAVPIKIIALTATEVSMNHCN
ncbi:hypothetical protein EPB74_12465 [Psychrobacter sp. DAB_AL62B]|nr:hypothetical protein [Psychrobacter sp. DAB_AL62B]